MTSDRAERNFVWTAAAVMLFTRLAILPRHLADWDAAEFAAALHRFDILAQQPHAPGFPLFVLAGRLFYLLVGDERLALSTVSILASVATIPLLHRLGRAWLDPRGARVLVIWWLTFPLVWYYGPLQLTYPLEAAAVLGLVLLWRHAWSESPAPLPAWAVGLLFGLAGGVRLSTWAILGLPALLLLARWPWRQRLRFIGGFVLGAVLWLVPTVMLTGGWAEYRAAGAGLTRGFFTSESLLGGNPSGSLRHLGQLAGYLLEAFGVPGSSGQPAVVVSVYVVLLAVVAVGLRGLRDRRAARFCRLWLLGGVAYLVLFHMGQAGYLLALLPPLGVAVVLVVRRILAPFERLTWDRGGWLLAAALLGGWNSAVFLAGDLPFSLARLAEHDRRWDDRITGVRQGYDPDSTWLFSYGDFREAVWALPNYHHLHITLLFREPSRFPLAIQNVYQAKDRRITPRPWYVDTGFRPAPIAIPAHVRYLVTFDVALTWIYDGDEPLRGERVGDAMLWSLPVPPGSRLVYGYGHWRLEPGGEDGSERDGGAG